MKLFGTDGIRGIAGKPPLDRETVARVGAALVRARRANGSASPVTVLVGRDTRESGVWIERELARGLASEGAQVVTAGVMPTPGIAYLTRSEGFDLGVVISASHNPYEDNGIKVFSGAGEKLTGALEAQVESAVADGSWQVPADAEPRLEARDFLGAYDAHLMKVLSSAGPLAGSRIVIDCANGATSPVAFGLFRDLGFDVVAIGVEPDGRNINLGCGSTHLDALRARVLAERARLGVAFDGDGDRALFVDAGGAAVDGDAVMLMIAEHLARHDRLPGMAVVATVMSNVGLELALRERGIALIRTAVGDKYVMEEMLARGLALGGEQSGHIILGEHLFTGDGMATALQVLAIMAETGRELADLASALVTYPQVLVNVRVREKVDLAAVPEVAGAMTRVESRLGGEGRLLVRYSGTEPLLRIMLEGKHQREIEQWAHEIADAVRQSLGAP